MVGKVDITPSLMKLTVIWEWEKNSEEVDRGHTFTLTLIHTHTVVAVYKKK